MVISAVQQRPSDEISIHPYLTGVPRRIKHLEMPYDCILASSGAETAMAT